MRLLAALLSVLFLSNFVWWAFSGDDTTVQQQRPSAVVFRDGCQFVFPIQNIEREWKWGIGEENDCEYRWVVTIVVDKTVYQIGYTNFNGNPGEKRGTFAELVESGQADIWRIDRESKSGESVRDIRVQKRTTGQALVIEIANKEWTEKLFANNPMKLTFTAGGTQLSEVESMGTVEYKRDENLAREKNTDDAKKKVTVPKATGYGVSDTDIPNYQLPDVGYWVKAGHGHFENHGVRDPSAPNMLLNQWSPNEPRETPLHSGTLNALRDDSAVAIDLHNVRLTPQLQTQLSRLQRLQWLNVSLGVNGSDFRWLADIKGLRGLSLTHANLEPADFESLGKAKGLQYLNLYWSKFTAADFAKFPNLEKLETLNLGGKHVDDNCLRRLSQLRLPKLRSLSVEAASITDSGMQRLCEVYNLEYLNLFHSEGVSPKSVENIGQMRKLRVLGVGGTGIAPQYDETAAVKELTRILPHCNVDYGD